MHHVLRTACVDSGYAARPGDRFRLAAAFILRPDRCGAPQAAGDARLSYRLQWSHMSEINSLSVRLLPFTSIAYTAY